jgi:Beta-propeller repeat
MPSGSTLLYSTYLGGSEQDASSDIAVDANGIAYITGETSSGDFPTQNPFQANLSLSDPNGASIDAFVSKLNAAGSALVYSTYLGGGNRLPDGTTIGGAYDVGYDIAVDSAGNAYVTGSAEATTFPTANPYQAAHTGIGPDAFVAKFDPTGAIIYSTYLGGSYDDSGVGIAIDINGNAYITGLTISTDFPIMNAFQSMLNSDGKPTCCIPDSFVTKLNATGTALVYSTYLGGSDDDYGLGVVVDTAGNAYLVGSTESGNFPMTEPFQATNAGSLDIYVTKLDPGGSTLVYSSYLGGSSVDAPVGIALDSAGALYLTGYISSANFPMVTPLQSNRGGTQAAFVAKIIPGNTPSANNVTVSPISGVMVTFASVSSPGETTVTISSGGSPAPSGFNLGNPPAYYTITTTAAYHSSVTVCITYNPAQSNNTRDFHLLHEENSAWVDVTISNDSLNNTICGRVASLSTFRIVERHSLWLPLVLG